MKNKSILLFLVLCFLFFISCDKEDIRLPNFFEELATVVKNGASINIQLDNGTVLMPNNSSTLKLKNGDRVFLNYTPLQNDSIKINRISPIFLGDIKKTDNIEEIKTEPVKIISRWVSGNYFNVSLQVDFHSKAHTIALLRDMEAEQPTLYLSYTRNDDPPGAPMLTYSSFKLEGLQNQDFTIYINTHEGEHKYEYRGGN